VGIFDFLSNKKQSFFTKEEEERMVEAIRSAEKQTSGEIRIYMEQHCKFINPLDRAKEVFVELEMFKTQDRNAVLLYIATKDNQLALLGDEGIYQKMGQVFWDNEVKLMLAEFKQHHFIDGVCHIIGDIGEALKTNFPYASDDKNELEDGIVYGK
jgi:uncharacterized membrane protein